MAEIDIEKAKRSQMRWLILETLNAARPIGASDRTILTAIQGIIADATLLEIRREMDYLEDRGLIKIEGREIQPNWHAELTHHGVDVAEYTVECRPGIARPKKWW
ncbi:MAG: hypothetical protein JW884_14195 [Deltaproteobacteria bacterium]|nr:hypothetical protein [Deltaproteobacteria bacterium]